MNDADPNLPHHEFATAIQRGDADRVRRLLASHPQLANAAGWYPPPLHCSVLWNQAEIAAILLDHAADIELRDPDRQTTALRYAVMYCRPDLIRLLWDRGADSGPITENGTSALQLAQHAADGAFAEHSDLPSPAAYRTVVSLLQDLQTQ